jgi:urease gamma subunit
VLLVGEVRSAAGVGLVNTQAVSLVSNHLLPGAGAGASRLCRLGWHVVGS